MNREILRLAFPNIISNISVPLLSSVDTALMGHLSFSHLGAVGISSMLFNFIYWNFGFLRMGTTGMAAQALGDSNDQKIADVLIKSVILALVIAFLLILFQNPILKWCNLLLNVHEDQVVLVNTYFKIRIWAAPASLLLFVAIGWFFGMQNAVIPLVITVAINGANIILSVYFVKYLGMGIQGVALGTLIAQYFGLLLACFFLLWKYREYILRKIPPVLGRMRQWLEFLKMNIDLFIRTVCLTFAFAFFYSMSSDAGPLVLASNVILLQFLNWMSYGIDGFAFASESLVGKYVGARNSNRVRSAIHYSFIWGGGLALFYSFIFLSFGHTLIGLFSSDAQVIELTYSQIYFLTALPVISFACYIWDGIFIGFTASSEMRNSMLAALIIYFVFYFAFKGSFINIIWISLILFLASRGLIQTLYWYYSDRFKRIRNIPKQL